MPSLELRKRAGNVAHAPMFDELAIADGKDVARIACVVAAAILLAASPSVAASLRDEYGKNLPVRLFPQPPPQAPKPAIEACEPPILAAEKQYNIPTGLLLAISIVETGRPDKRTGEKKAWPWSVNANGQGLFFNDRKSAVAWVLQAQKNGVDSIDIGCMQVNLAAHPTAFRTVNDGFDPAINADYAARFLLSLYQQSADWREAVGAYHSHTEEFAVPYREQVGRQFARSEPELARRQFIQSVVDERALLLRQLQLAWSATLAPPPQPAPQAEAGQPRSFP